MVGFLMPLTVVVPLGFLLQCVVGGEKHKLLSPKASYFLTLSKSIYGTASRQNLSYNMTQDQCEPYSTEKTCQSLQRDFTGFLCVWILDLDGVGQFRH